MTRPSLKSRIVDMIASPLARSYHLAQIARRVAQIYDNDGNADMQRNGESLLLRRIVGIRPAGVFFDVGANNGDWTAAALDTGFTGSLVAVDPLHVNVDGLRRRFAHRPAVRVVEYALSDYVGDATFYSNTDPKNSGTDSLFNMREIGYDAQLQTVSVTCSTVERVASEMGVSSIDFLKIDVEGNELRVLKGAAPLLEAGRIDFIQLEFGHAARAAKVYLHDIVNLAAGVNYSLFAIKPRGLAPLQFTPFLENRYSYINLLMVRQAVVGDLRTAILAR